MKRTFWNLSKGKQIGFIESSFKEGILFQCHYIHFRETSSNLAMGKQIQYNTRFLSDQDRANLGGFLVHKKPVMIHFKTELFSVPIKGDFLGEEYITDISELKEETIHTTFYTDQKEFWDAKAC